MRMMQEFSNKKDSLAPSSDNALKCIEKLPLPYTGNKKKLAFQIHKTILKHELKFDTVLDAFSGSATVSFLFKMMGKKVLSNDLLTNSYMNAVAFVENPGIKLLDEEKEYLLNHQNKNKGSFVEDNYLGNQFRKSGTSRFNKFTLQECQHLDNFRANIDDLCDRHLEGLGFAANAAVVLRLPFGNVDQSCDVLKHRVKQDKNYGKNSDKHDRRIGIYYDENYNLKFDKWFLKYAKDFMAVGQPSSPENAIKVKRAAFFANLQQHVLRDCFVGGRMHHGQVIAELDARLGHQKNQLKAHYSKEHTTEMNFQTQRDVDNRQPGEGLKWWTFADIELPGSCLAINMDVIDLLRSKFCDVDCVYFDPPYAGQSSDYASMYRFLEEYIYSDTLEHLPHLQNSARFVKKMNYEESFREMLGASSHIPIWLFSYNDSSWAGIEHICSIIREYKSDVVLETLNDQYRYLYRKRQSRDKSSVEYLIIAR